MEQGTQKKSKTGKTIPLDNFYGPEGVRATSVLNRGGYSVYVYSILPQEYWYSAYAVTLITPDQPYCVLCYRVEDQASKVAVVDDTEGKELFSFATSGQLETVYMPFKVKPGHRYRLGFYKLERIKFPVVYREVNLLCFDESSYAEAVQSDRRFALLETERFAAAALQKAKQSESPELLRLKEHLAYVADFLKAKAADALTNYEDTRNYHAWGLMLEPAFERGKKLIQAVYPHLEEAFYWPFYAASLAHFAIAFTSKGGTDPVRILADGEGTCYQQALLAEMFYALIHPDKPKPKTSVVSGDFYVLGHAFLRGPDFFADITDNIFLPISPERWNALQPFEKSDFLKEKAVFGIHLDISRDPSREKTLSQYTEAWLENWYLTVVKQLPYLRLMYHQVGFKK